MPRLRSLFTPLNFGRLILLGVLLFSAEQLDEMRPPWKSAWARHRAEGKEPTFNEHLSTGLWYGAAARVGLCGLLLVVSLGWGVKREPGSGTTFMLGKKTDPQLSPQVFGVVLGVIVLGALAMRLPRMDHSFWGDEAHAVGAYIHGNFRPVDKTQLDGPLFFEQPTWEQTFFSARHGANNHVVFSATSRLCLNLWQKITGQPHTAFTEWIIRLPVLIAGLGALITMALLLKRWGAPLPGLMTAAFLTMHPWHVRYGVEARGYAFMLLFVPAFLICLTNALEKNRWRDWLAVALMEFLIMYSWAGVMYALAMVNVAAAALMLMRRDRLPLLIRWLTANLLAAAVFVSLYLPHVPQIESARRRLLWLKGLPMDKVWFHNLLTQPFTGISYHEQYATNPHELSWERLLSQSPVLTGVGFVVLFGAFTLGFFVMWRRSKPVALVVTSVLSAAIICTLHFKYILEDELRPWYLIFTLPFLAMCVALGWLEAACFCARCVPQRWRNMTFANTMIALVLLMSASLWPANASLVSMAEENYKGAVAATIARHEPFSPDATSGVLTVWLWRFSALYDPRGESRARDLATVQPYMERALQTGKELYVIVGFRDLAQLKSADILAVLEDTARFERTATFHSRESLHSLDVYRMKRP
ncbi:dolichyl-phosphate-mannose-protein mannosyltransferase [Roseimicrobium gellanilyticum]|uniref:Dolichyl-phosphate-mannose-protein mannosyltransferase n=1 Tax=Roseimicrobium gellanilyticum TaxID=748857 RepID=A0A366HQL5_9BACT|nr:glycosyltransferase family 39 protein [Roseimicrobium gellanilyticum]RBP45149.1 dolichyl-phosphate-mannose-protein mannosyltransferase [Roseimicrobium gellanilyticum]